ncbi:ATP synthase F1 subunit delta [Crateriforma conspicua]|uniref:ATP synthase subunit delta n=1 Tax=Crateriforma conspicua TaxID=2527996 RepID=A0A5C5Y5I2_9PLAN|nr:ATP synthase F1 subunit delta [Crateriforma conspicua]QDV65083.1 ATP synthase subunit delta [Crateriforma conspicua]TWT70480.1 ATP synthase subunit delta [Crateriforma conspicua]
MSEATEYPTVLDIGAEQLGKTYARALMAAAHNQGVADEVLGQLGEIVDEGLSANPRLAAALASPRVSESEKNAVVDRLFAGQIHPVLTNALKVMNAHGRLGYLRAVRDAATDIRDEQLGRVVAEIRTAVPITDDLREVVLRRLGETLGRHVRLNERIDTDLIGGMVVRVGDTVFDSSVAGRLAKVRQKVRDGFSQQLLRRAEAFVTADVGSSDDTDSSDAAAQ